MDRETSNKISILSFIAAFMVVMMHSVCTMDCSGWCARVYLSYGYDGLWNFSVPYFFVVAGYFTMNGYSDGKWSYSRAVYKRFWSLVVPYFVWNVIWLLAVTLPHCGWRIGGVDYLEAFGISAITPCNSPLWFVKVLFILVCCSPIVVRIVSRLHGKEGMLAFIAAALVLGMPLPGIKTIYRAFFYFSVGVWISIGLIRVKRNERMLKVGWLVWFVLCGIQSVVRFEWFFLCIPLLAVPLVWFSYDLFSEKYAFVRRVCSDVRIIAICKTSFFVYCVHGIIVSYHLEFQKCECYGNDGNRHHGFLLFCCSWAGVETIRQARLWISLWWANEMSEGTRSEALYAEFGKKAVRCVGIDLLRGIAAFGIVGCHLSLMPRTAGGEWATAFCDLNVGVFAAIAGWLMGGDGGIFSHREHKEHRGMAEVLGYAGRRAKRLLPTYFFWSIVFIAATCAFDLILDGGRLNPKYGTVAFWRKVVFLGDAATHLWFLPCLLYAQVVMKALEWVAARTECEPCRVGVTCLVLGLGLSAISCWLGNWFGTYPLRLFAFLVTGYGLGRMEVKLPRAWSGGLTVVGLVAYVSLVGMVPAFVRGWFATVPLLGFFAALEGNGFSHREHKEHREYRRRE